MFYHLLPPGFSRLSCLYIYFYSLELIRRGLAVSFTMLQQREVLYSLTCLSLALPLSGDKHGPTPHSRFLVVETTVAPPRSLPIAAPLHQRASSPSDDRMASSTRGVGTPATVADADSPVVAKDDRNGTERSNGEANCEDGGGQIHVLLRQV